MKHTPSIPFLLALFFLTTILSAQQNQVIRGTITDAETKERIIGATVTEYDSDNRIIGGTISDPNGNFVLNVKNPENLFRVSYIGYQAFDFNLDGRETESCWNWFQNPFRWKRWLSLPPATGIHCPGWQNGM